ncbi:MAG TPA: C40 family peptidase [Ilumatobacter sp.]
MMRSHDPSQRTTVRRLALVVAVVVAGFAVPQGAGAATRTSSLVIAAQAAQALESLAEWQSTQNPADYVRFVQTRDQAAVLVGDELDIDVHLLRNDWATVDADRQVVVLSALSQIGVKYRYAQALPGVAFDCSGLISWAYEQIGIELPRRSVEQFRASTETDAEGVSAGDIVHYPGHISLYLGAGLMVHAPNSASLVEVAVLSKRSLRYGVLVDLPRTAAADPVLVDLELSAP